MDLREKYPEHGAAPGLVWLRSLLDWPNEDIEIVLTRNQFERIHAVLRAQERYESRGRWDIGTLGLVHVIVEDS